MEEERRARWRDENVRRRTDYIPFAFQLLSALAERGQLAPLVEKAQEAHLAKQQQQRQAASAGG
jgi:ubiquitin carboxyl-terminal hydrolase L5